MRRGPLTCPSLQARVIILFFPDEYSTGAYIGRPLGGIQASCDGEEKALAHGLEYDVSISDIAKMKPWVCGLLNQKICGVGAVHPSVEGYQGGRQRSSLKRILYI